MIGEPKSHLTAEDKNLLALIVKIELAHQVCLAKVKQRKLVQTAFVLIVLRKAVMQVNQKVKAQALEIQIPTHHAVLGAESSEYR